MTVTAEPALTRARPAAADELALLGRSATKIVLYHREGVGEHHWEFRFTCGSPSWFVVTIVGPSGERGHRATVTMSDAAIARFELSAERYPTLLSAHPRALRQAVRLAAAYREYTDARPEPAPAVDDVVRGCHPVAFHARSGDRLLPFRLSRAIFDDRLYVALDLDGTPLARLSLPAEMGLRKSSRKRASGLARRFARAWLDPTVTPIASGEAR